MQPAEIYAWLTAQSEHGMRRFRCAYDSVDPGSWRCGKPKPAGCARPIRWASTAMRCANWRRTFSLMRPQFSPVGRAKKLAAVRGRGLPARSAAAEHDTWHGIPVSACRHGGAPLPAPESSLAGSRTAQPPGTRLAADAAFRTAGGAEPCRHEVEEVLLPHHLPRRRLSCCAPHRAAPNATTSTIASARKAAKACSPTRAGRPSFAADVGFPSSGLRHVTSPT